MQYFLSHWQIIAAIILGVYEVLVRAIPTVKDWSLLALIIKVLQVLSDNLNAKRLK